MKRKIESALKEWKENTDHKPLLIKGCRQCGKTYSVIKFAKANYQYVVYLNFMSNPEYSAIFDKSLEVDALVMYISAILGKEAKIVPGKTCIVFDEIQECPRARASIKFFKLDGRYDIIATGSLLGLDGYRDDFASIPVGYETRLEMFPMDFEEFLWAQGVSESVIDSLKEHYRTLTPIPDVIHNHFRDLLLQYVVVGGMPEVVKEFSHNHNFYTALCKQRDIVEAYREDMLKYAAREDRNKIRECFNSIPQQLSKENKKFQYSIIRKKGTAQAFAGCLQWIEDAGIIQRCHNLTITELPLDGNADNSVFKVYMSDIGLFISMLEDGTQSSILQGNLLGYKGAIFEALVADFFCKNNRKLYYFRKDSGLEVDFVIRYRGKCTLVECKATTGNTKSSATILKHPEKYHVEEVIKLGDYNIGHTGPITTLPLYLGFLLRET